MKAYFAIALALVAATEAAAGPWNEAVGTDAFGRRVVDLPPTGDYRPEKYPPKAPKSWDAINVPRGHLLEGPSGLVECVKPFYWGGGACVPYVPGQQQRKRAWIVKQQGRWLQCPERNSQAGCIELYKPGKFLHQYKVQ